MILLPGLVMLGFRAAEPGTSGAAPAAAQVEGSNSIGPSVTASTRASLDPASSATTSAGASEPDQAGPSPSDAHLVATAKPSSFPGSAATPKPTPKPTPKAPNPTPTPVPPQPPPGASLALGVWSGQPWNPGSLDAVTSMLGRTPSIFLTYIGWDRPFYSSDEAEIANRGAAHVVTWEPNGFTLKSIADGSHDAFIQAWAQGAAAWGGRIYLRPMHEMNGDWYSWGRGVNGNTPSDFVEAWRHMHDIFVAAGATNVKWVFSPNVRYGNYPFADLYPGSAYVDWLALDGYNWGLDHHLGTPSWQSFADIFGATYSEIIALAPGKPMMIAETASTENGGDKGQWILTTFLNDVPKYPVVKAVIWFNQADGPSNFRIDSSAASLAAFKQVVNSGAWHGHLP